MADVLNILDVPVGGSTTFLGLTDTPGAYTGAAGDVVSVNGGESALEFTTPASAPVTSVFGRTGAVVAADDDYAATQLADETDGVMLTWDAAGEAILFGPGTAGQVVTSNGAGAPPSFQDLPEFACVLARRTTAFVIPTVATTMPLDATDIETDSAVIEHNNTNTEIIDVKVAGLYLVGWLIDIDDPGAGNNYEIVSQIDLNGALLAGVTDDVAVFNDSSIPGDIHEGSVGGCAPFIAAANDTIEVSLRTAVNGGAGTGDTEPGALLWVLGPFPTA